MEWINFRHLYSFWMVCQTGGFKKAAVKMNVSQSAVSEQVSHLEDYLQVSLLTRSTRTFDLTQEGRSLLGYAEVIFDQSREINDLIRDKSDPKVMKSLKIGIVGGVSRNFLFRIVSSYVKENAHTTVSVITGSYEELNGLLKKYELDLVITLELPAKKDLGDVIYQKIGQSWLCLAGPKKTIEKLNKGLLKEPLNLFKFSFPYEVDVIDTLLKPQMGQDFSVKADTDDIPLLRFFANSDEGLVLVPKIGVLEDIEKGALDFVPLNKGPEINIYAIFMKKQIHRESITTLISQSENLS